MDFQVPANGVSSWVGEPMCSLCNNPRVNAGVRVLEKCKLD